MTVQQGQLLNPPVSRSGFDAKGGGGGGGGGAIAIHSLGPIVIKTTGRILARGGRGGGGEVIGHSSFGGSGGGGSGGAIILNSAERIVIEHEDWAEGDYGILDVSGGFGSDARESSQVTFVEIPNGCALTTSGGS